MKRYILASHHSLAAGLKDTLEFLIGTSEEITDISAYMNENGDENLEEVVAALFARFQAEDIVIVMTDLVGGSVNQKFYPYMGERVFLFSGINLPLALQLVLASEEDFNPESIHKLVDSARAQLVYVNELEQEKGDDDE